MKTHWTRVIAALGSALTTFVLLQGVVSLAEPAADVQPTLIAHTVPATTSR